MNDRSGIFSGENPLKIAKTWLEKASRTETSDHNAVTLATVDEGGLPNARIVLLKDISYDEFIFYTNYNSAKSKELITNGKAALVIHWKSLKRQIRVRGLVKKENGKIADLYFSSRPSESRIGAWTSKQSQPLESRKLLLEEFEKNKSKRDLENKRPDFWGGFKLRPLEIEFWSEGDFRLHDRFKWFRAGLQDDWVVSRLYP